MTYDAGVGDVSDLLLAPETGDLALADGQLILARGQVAVGQYVRQALLTFKGEWFLDLNAGIPYLERVLVKNPRMSEIRAIIAERVLACPGVNSVEDVTIELDPGTRLARVSIRANGGGLVVRGEVG